METTKATQTVDVDFAINDLCRQVHEANKKQWLCFKCSGPTTLRENASRTGQIKCDLCKGSGKKERNVGELLMLVVSELSEALEGYRKDLMDDKLPPRKMFEVEIAGALIRLFDIGGGLGLDLGGAFVEKMDYNAKRGCGHSKEAHGGTFPKASSGIGKCCLCGCIDYKREE
jgi:hypothetical protein